MDIIQMAHARERAWGCADCGKHEMSSLNCIDQGGTGYATTDSNQKVCYTCCAERDKADMRNTGRFTGYLTAKQQPNGMRVYWVGNWPGSLKLHVGGAIKYSFHNFVGRDGRRDFWFTFEGTQWHGVNIGDSDIAHCKRIKD